ncbi:MAG: hypothetical protein LBU09_03365, partial [Endomicrobium sp.]|nr:hypothetical protein [Endomicrobium sp.]
MKKLIAGFTAFVFIFSVISPPALAALPQSVLTTAPKILSISEPVVSYSFGKINAGKIFGDLSSQNQIIINIQDLHCNPPAQRNIAAILKQLEKKYGLNAVYCEGAYSDIDAGWINGLDENKANALLETLIDSGRLSASEYYSANSGNKTIKGLEDSQIHAQNLARFAAILEKRNYYKERIKLLDRELALLKNKYFGFHNKRFNVLLERYKDGKIPADKYYRSLLKYVEKANKGQDAYDSVYYVNINAYPNVRRYIAIGNLAKTLNYGRITRQLRLFIDELKGKLPYSVYKNLLDSTNNFSNLNDLYFFLPQILKDYGIVLDSSKSDLKLFLGYVQREMEFNPLELEKEEKRLAEKIRLALSQDKSELEISFAADFYGYFKNYLLASITAQDYAYFKERFDEFKSVWEQYAYESELENLKDDFNEISQFYDINFKRDEIFADKIGLETRSLEARPLEAKPHAKETAVLSLNAQELSAALAKADLRAVITGGFHSEGLQNICEKNRVSYITITPNVSGISNSNEVYERLAKMQATQMAAAAAAAYSSQNMERKASQSAISLALGSNNAKIKFKDNAAIVELNGETLNLRWDGQKFSLADTETQLSESKIFSSEIKEQILSNTKRLLKLGNPAAFISSELIYAFVKTFSQIGLNSGFLSGNGLIWKIASNKELIDAIRKDYSSLNDFASLPDALQKYIAFHISAKQGNSSFSNSILSLIMEKSGGSLYGLLEELKNIIDFSTADNGSVFANGSEETSEKTAKLELPLISAILKILPFNERTRAKIAAVAELPFFMLAQVFPNAGKAFIDLHGKRGMAKRYMGFMQIQAKTLERLPQHLRAAAQAAADTTVNLGFFSKLALFFSLMLNPAAKEARAENIRGHIAWNLTNPRYKLDLLNPQNQNIKNLSELLAALNLSGEDAEKFTEILSSNKNAIEIIGGAKYEFIKGQSPHILKDGNIIALYEIKKREITFVYYGENGLELGKAERIKVTFEKLKSSARKTENDNYTMTENLFTDGHIEVEIRLKGGYYAIEKPESSAQRRTDAGKTPPKQEVRAHSDNRYAEGNGFAVYFANGENIENYELEFETEEESKVTSLIIRNKNTGETVEQITPIQIRGKDGLILTYFRRLPSYKLNALLKSRQSFTISGLTALNGEISIGARQVFVGRQYDGQKITLEAEDGIVKFNGKEMSLTDRRTNQNAVQTENITDDANIVRLPSSGVLHFFKMTLDSPDLKPYAMQRVKVTASADRILKVETLEGQTIWEESPYIIEIYETDEDAAEKPLLQYPSGRTPKNISKNIKDGKKYKVKNYAVTAENGIISFARMKADIASLKKERADGKIPVVDFVIEDKKITAVYKTDGSLIYPLEIKVEKLNTDGSFSGIAKEAANAAGIYKVSGYALSEKGDINFNGIRLRNIPKLAAAADRGEPVNFYFEINQYNQRRITKAERIVKTADGEIIETIYEDKSERITVYDETQGKVLIEYFASLRYAPKEAVDALKQNHSLKISGLILPPKGGIKYGNLKLPSSAVDAYRNAANEENRQPVADIAISDGQITRVYGKTSEGSDITVWERTKTNKISVKPQQVKIYKIVSDASGKISREEVSTSDFTKSGSYALSGLNITGQMNKKTGKYGVARITFSGSSLKYDISSARLIDFAYKNKAEIEIENGEIARVSILNDDGSILKTFTIDELRPAPSLKLELPIISKFLNLIPFISAGKRAKITAAVELSFFMLAQVFPNAGRIFIGWHGKRGMLQRYRAFRHIQAKTLEKLPEQLHDAVLNAAELPFFSKLSLFFSLMFNSAAKAARDENMREHIDLNLAGFADITSEHKGIYSEIVRSFFRGDKNKLDDIISDQSQETYARLYALLKRLRLAAENGEKFNLESDNIKSLVKNFVDHERTAKDGKDLVKNNYELRAKVMGVHLIFLTLGQKIEGVKNFEITKEVKELQNKTLSSEFLEKIDNAKLVGGYNNANAKLKFGNRSEYIKIYTIAHELGHNYLTLLGFYVIIHNDEYTGTPVTFHELFAKIFSYLIYMAVYNEYLNKDNSKADSGSMGESMARITGVIPTMINDTEPHKAAAAFIATLRKTLGENEGIGLDDMFKLFAGSAEFVIESELNERIWYTGIFKDKRYRHSRGISPNSFLTQSELFAELALYLGKKWLPDLYNKIKKAETKDYFSSGAELDAPSISNGKKANRYIYNGAAAQLTTQSAINLLSKFGIKERNDEPWENQELPKELSQPKNNLKTFFRAFRDIFIMPLFKESIFRWLPLIFASAAELHPLFLLAFSAAFFIHSYTEDSEKKTARYLLDLTVSTFAFSFLALIPSLALFQADGLLLNTFPVFSVAAHFLIKFLTLSKVYDIDRKAIIKFSDFVNPFASKNKSGADKLSKDSGLNMHNTADNQALQDAIENFGAAYSNENGKIYTNVYFVQSSQEDLLAQGFAQNIGWRAQGKDVWIKKDLEKGSIVVFSQAPAQKVIETFAGIVGSEAKIKGSKIALDRIEKITGADLRGVSYALVIDHNTQDNYGSYDDNGTLVVSADVLGRESSQIIPN